MRIFVISSSHTYEAPHLEISIPVGFASGFMNNGVDAAVLWGGETDTIHGVPHFRYGDVTPTLDDVLLVSNPNIEFLDRYGYGKDAKVKLRIQFTSCNHQAKDWADFPVILAENTAMLEAKYPNNLVVPCLMGCPENIEIKDSPYSRPTVLFCGRIADYPPRHSYRLDDLFRLADLLPEFDFAIISNYITLPFDKAPELVKGCAIVIESRPNLPVSYSANRVRLVYISSNNAIGMINQAIGRSNLYYAGAKSFGTFWEWYHYAWTCLDFGFEAAPMAPNTKVIDPLRAGGRIVAYGNSPTFHLIQDYEAGHVVGFRDVQAMANCIRNLPPETTDTRLARAEKFRSGEGWNTRTKFVLSQIQGLL